MATLRALMRRRQAPGLRAWRKTWDYTADRWGLDPAETYTRQLWKDIAAVAECPSLGRDCSEARRGYRKYPSGSHVLFYRPTTDGIDVVRILHERMDYERHIP